ncbi:MAG: MlaD family protein [Marmoricola sp.]
MRVFDKVRGLSPLQLGAIFVVVAALAGVALFSKAQILAYLRGGDEIQIHFAAAHRLRPDISVVKVAGVKVGIVMDQSRESDGSTDVTVKVDKSALAVLGDAPSASIRPATLLGGNYYVELVPGGRPGAFQGSIPESRTSIPVELDGLASSFTTPARQGVRASTRQLNAVLGAGGTQALRSLVTSASGTLAPASSVFAGLQGKPTDGTHDLSRLVTGFAAGSRVMSSQDANLAATLENLATISTVLDQRRVDLARATASMPETLGQTRTMLGRLDGVLTSLDNAAGPTRPTVQALGRMLTVTDPVLVKALPIVHQLRGVLADANPVVSGLVPIASNLQTSMANLQGPVLSRINGPIMHAVLSPWSGTGVYAGGGANRPLYKEIGYMFTNLASANMFDANGAMISFLPGAGPGSLSGLPFSLEKFFSKYAGSIR